MILTDDRVVDLSHPLYRRRERHAYDANANPISRMIPDNWYIECEAKISGCAGTHIELPYRCAIDGTNCLNYPLDGLIGDAVIMDFTAKKDGEQITLDDVRAYEKQLAGVKIAVLWCGVSKNYRADNWAAGPCLAQDALEWLLTLGLGAIGTDAATLESRESSDEVIRHRSFAAGVPMIYCLNNLESIDAPKATFVVLPLSMQRMDSSPVRVVAIKE